MVPPLQDSPVLPYSTPSSESISDGTIYLDDVASRTSRTPSSTPKRRFSYVQRYSLSGADISLTITEPKYYNPYALHLGPRLSLPPDVPELKYLPPPQAVRISVPQQVYQPSTLSNVLRAVQYDDPQDCAIEHAHRLWSPWPLRTITLLALLVFFAACIAALEVLSLLSKRDGGLGQWSENARFVWTYSPPLIFFIIVSVWGQVEYRTKQLMPWRTMAAAPASASHSILLNYITPLNALAFVQSINFGHPGVATSIVAGVSIKLLVVTSTAILSLQGESLIVQPVPLRMMEGFLALLVLLTAAMLLLRPCPATPNDTSTITGLAAVVSNSPGYTAILRGLATASPETLERELYKHRYQTNVGYKGNEPFFRISLATKENAAPTTLTSNLRTSTLPEKWWSPIHDLTRLSILVVTFGAIVTVELLHQRSQKNNGLMNMPDSSSLRYAWQMVPAAISVIIFMLVGLVDYATRLIQPFLSLKQGNEPAGKTIHINYLSDLAPGAVRRALMNRHFGVVLTATAVLIAPVLTIVGAGLFSPASMETSIETNFRITSVLDPSINKTSDMTVVAHDVINSQGDSWPSWTWNNLAVPTLTYATSSNSDTTQTLDIRTTAAYSTLNCTAIPNTNVKIWTSTNNGSTNQPAAINLAIQVDDGCGALCRTTADVNTCDGKSYIYTSFNSPSPQALIGSMFPSKPVPTPERWRDDCPQLSVAYGQAAEDGTQITELVVMNCYPAIMQAEANATITMPQGLITAAKTNMSTTKRIGMGERATIDLNAILSGNSSNNTSSMDSTFIALTTARDAIPLNKMLGESNSEHVEQALDQLYGIVMAQHLNLQSRNFLSNMSSKADDILTGDLKATSDRLVQDQTSTRIIEGVLGTIFFLLAVASVITETRRILPYNPFSIARMSSLIAESNLIDGIVPAGSEWNTNKNIQETGIFDMFLFSLGLFEKSRGLRRIEKVFGIDAGDAEILE